MPTLLRDVGMARSYGKTTAPIIQWVGRTFLCVALNTKDRSLTLTALTL